MPEWSTEYLPYKKLKKLLKALVEVVSNEEGAVERKQPSSTSSSSVQGHGRLTSDKMRRRSGLITVRIRSWVRPPTTPHESSHSPSTLPSVSCVARTLSSRHSLHLFLKSFKTSSISMRAPCVEGCHGGRRRREKWSGR